MLIILILFLSSAADDDRDAKTALDSTAHYNCTFIKDGALLTAGIACDLTAYLVDNSVQPLTAQAIGRLTPESVNQFDRGATDNYSPAIGSYSTLLTGFLLLAPAGLLSNTAVRQDWAPVSSMYLEVLLFSYALPSFGKGITERNRPFVYNPSVPIEKKETKDARLSFFSRHATMAFASSVFLSTVYGTYNPECALQPWLWTITLIGASAVGYMRYESGDHFPTDLLAGAAVGSFIGYGVPWLHEPRKKRTTVSVNPLQKAIFLTREI